MSYQEDIKKVKLEITAVNTDGESIKYTIDYVNPNATAEQLHVAAETLNNTLTTNAFTSVQRIEYSNLVEV